MLRTSYLTLGGWDERDYYGNIAWFSTSHCSGAWNLTMNDFKIGDVSVTHKSTAPVMFQTGYPYIGLPSEVYDSLIDMLIEY